tara:strand:- start:16871 stop:17575 length:705 start_codon:yes stop_codon:yes gene_type:complete
MKPLISVDNLYKEYSENLPEPVKVLQDLNVKVFRGEFVSLMGPSGSGKSTLLNLLGLLDSPTNGTITFQQREVSKLTHFEKARLRNSSFGFIFQGFNLLKKNSVLENVMLPLLYSKVTRDKAVDAAKNILYATGLESLTNRFPSQLSGGQQQRVAICRALVVQPQVVLADEPTGNLDSATAIQIMKILRDLNRDQGITIILVTHEKDIASYGSRLIQMRDGVIQKDDTLGIKER